MRWIIRALVSLLILVVVLIGGLFLLPTEKIAQLASEKLRASTGREVTLTGSLSPSVWPQVGVSTGPLTLSNADWSKEGDMLRAEGLSVGLDMSALLSGEIKIRKLELQSPEIILEQAADGRTNWTFEPPANNSAQTTSSGGGSGEGGSSDAAAPTEFTVDKAAITNAKLTYIDHVAGTRTTIDALNATVTLPKFDGPAELDVAARMNGQTVAAALKLNQFNVFLSGAVSPVSGTLSAGGSTIRFDGRAGTAPVSAEGALNADVSDLDALFTALGQPKPALPKGVGKIITTKGNLTYTPEGSVHLRSTTLQLDSNTITGDADITLNGKPRLTGSFTAGALDLRAFIGGETSKKSGGGNGGGSEGNKKDSADGWSSAPIDVSALAALDAEVAIVADSIDLGDAKLGKTRILATLTDRRLVLKLREVRAYSGLITGEFVVNGRGSLSVGGDLNIGGMATQALLADLAGYDRLQGSGDLNLKFLGSGKSMKAIMNSLSGSGNFKVGKGQIRGLDLAGMLRNLDTNYIGDGSRTIFDSIGASFKIKDGVLRNDDLSMLAPLLNAIGLGKINLGKQNLDYRITPTAFSGGNDGEGFKVPLMITGSWANPKFNIDLEALAEQRLNLKERQKELEADAKKELKKAEERAKKQAAKKLGLQTEDGEDVEKAARKKLKKKAQKELKKLLGGN